MPGYAKPCWIASPIERTSSKPELSRIAFDGLSRGRTKEPKHSNKASRRNVGPWKAWKVNFSLSTLPTILGHPATPAGCSHSHRSYDSPLYKGQAQNPALNLNHGWARLNFRSAHVQLPKAVKKLTVGMDYRTIQSPLHFGRTTAHADETSEVASKAGVKKKAFINC